LVLEPDDRLAAREAIMAQAGISGTPAMPKGLRHGFGVSAFQANIPPHIVQRWLGHASLRTAGIYGDVVGPDKQGVCRAHLGSRGRPAPISTARISRRIDTAQETIESGLSGRRRL
jgi:integrase